jgi:fructose-1-phosphate kinase PfkB-like protein
VNLDEARDALGEPAISPESAVRALISAGALHAIVTAGREGAVMALEDGSLIRLRPPVQGIHTVGVGDAFLGGVAVGIMQGEDLRGAAVMGIAAAAASATVPGAGRIDVASMARLRSEVAVSSANRLDEL